MDKMSDAEKVEPSSRCPSPYSGESEHDASSGDGDAKNAEFTPAGDCEQLEYPIDPSLCLIDHPEILTSASPAQPIPKEGEEEKEKLEDAILRSDRLKDLMNTPRNEITSFPDPETITAHFRCGTCNEIPFPWCGDPDMMIIDEDGEPEPFPETVFLCAAGHVVCRACAQSFGSCAYSKSGITPNDSEEEEEDGEEEGDTSSEYSDIYQYKFGMEPLINEDGEEVEPTFSMDSWGRNRVCLAPIDLDSRDFLLAKLIEDSEFACRNLYNKCSFRGRGKALQEHEKNCEFKESLPNSNAECSGSGQPTEKECETPQIENKENSNDDDDDDDDSAILRFDLAEARAKAAELIAKIQADRAQFLDHIPGWDQQDEEEEDEDEQDEEEPLSAEEDLDLLQPDSPDSSSRGK